MIVFLPLRMMQACGVRLRVMETEVATVVSVRLPDSVVMPC